MASHSNQVSWQPASASRSWMDGWRALVTDLGLQHQACLDFVRENYDLADERAQQAAAATLWIEGRRVLAQQGGQIALWQPHPTPRQNLYEFPAYARHCRYVRGQKSSASFAGLVMQLSETPIDEEATVLEAMERLGFTPERSGEVRDWSAFADAVLLVAASGPAPYSAEIEDRLTSLSLDVFGRSDGFTIR